jgi:hypothetical protein
MSTNNKKNTRLGFGIRSRLVFGLTLFVIIVLIIVWIFQVLLLDYFYEQTKLSELNSVQKGIDAGIVSGDLDSVCGDLASEYNVLYVAETYATPVRYYVDEVNDTNWIGSSTIAYRVIDFTTSTTLYDFGLSLNMFKPAYTSDGELLYTGPINFTALLETESINIMYKTITEPEDPEGIDYPHRFLFL